MAGDWIKMRCELACDPDVIALAAALELPEDQVVGLLLRFWGWASTHTIDGNAQSVTENWIDRYLGVTGFAQALTKIGWLSVAEDGISVPGFERYLSEGAKVRALTSSRQAKHKSRRKRQRSNAPTVTREEKRREGSCTAHKNTGRARFTPPTVEEVAAYCRERGNQVDPQTFVDHYTSNGWKVGKNPMKDWRAAVRTWEKNDYQGGTSDQTRRKPDGRIR